MTAPFFEKTIQNEVHYKGNALFTGDEVEISILPAEEGSGIVFEKLLSGGKKRVMPANHEAIANASNRNTIISDGTDEGAIYCVEHLLSALYGCGISNAIIRVKGHEIPIFDGSAAMIVDLIESGGIVEQKEITPKVLTEPTYWSKGDMHIIALPSEETRFSYTLSYHGHPLLSSQFFTLPYTVRFFEEYKKEIAPARTFCLYEEATALLESGAIKGGSLDCAIVIKGEEILNPEGLRFNDEMVRHKVLDMIGDLSLIGSHVNAHFIGIRSGHEANGVLVKKVAEHLNACEKKDAQGVCV